VADAAGRLGPSRRVCRGIGARPGGSARRAVQLLPLGPAQWRKRRARDRVVANPIEELVQIVGDDPHVNVTRFRNRAGSRPALRRGR